MFVFGFLCYTFRVRIHDCNLTLTPLCCKAEKRQSLYTFKCKLSSRRQILRAQTIFANKKAETVTSVAEVYLSMGISKVTFYNSKKKDGGFRVTEFRELQLWKRKNPLLKEPAPDLSLQEQMLRMCGPAAVSYKQIRAPFINHETLTQSNRQLHTKKHISHFNYSNLQQNAIKYYSCNNLTH